MPIPFTAYPYVPQENNLTKWERIFKTIEQIADDKRRQSYADQLVADRNRNSQSVAQESARRERENFIKYGSAWGGQQPYTQDQSQFLEQYPYGLEGGPRYQGGVSTSTTPSPGMPGLPKAPTGYRYTPDGNLEAIPGGPAGMKVAEKSSKEMGLQQAAMNQADIVIGKVDQALQKVSGWSAGIGSRLSVIPGTSARDLENDINTIKANLGFAQLQEMRRNSPTGGALGQIAVQELNMLQSTVAALDTAQSKEQLRQRLMEVRQHYQNWKDTATGRMPTNVTADENIQAQIQSQLPAGTRIKGIRRVR